LFNHNEGRKTNQAYLSQSITISILILTSLIFAIIGILYSIKNNSIKSYLNADRNIRKESLTASLVASCFGVWILIGPSEAATWGGLGAIIGYAFGQACPFLAFYFFGKRMRKIMPNGNSLTQFVFLRFGSSVFKLVLFLTIFYMLVYLTAEVTAVAKVVNLLSNIPLWQTSLIILIATLSYTLYGGLKVSIFTDKIQFVIIFILLFFSIHYIYNLDSSFNALEKINEKAGHLISKNYFYGYTAGLTFFIAVFATNLFDQGIWQRVYAAKSIRDLKIGFISSFFIVVPFIFILGFFGLLAVATGKVVDPSTIFFSLLLEPLKGTNLALSISLLILVLVLVISSMDTLINAISSLITIESTKFFKFKHAKNYLQLSKYIILVLSIFVFYTASKGYSVLFMFLFADLLCCAAVFPIFYGMYKGDVSSKISFNAILAGLVLGLLIFPDQSFQSSFLIGRLFDAKIFPEWISTALLFWSFIFATFLPMIVILFFRDKKLKFSYLKLKTIKDLKN
jgi:SSS family solute:Na+ symporter